MNEWHTALKVKKTPTSMTGRPTVQRKSHRYLEKFVRKIADG